MTIRLTETAPYIFIYRHVYASVTVVEQFLIESHPAPCIWVCKWRTICSLEMAFVFVFVFFLMIEKGKKLLVHAMLRWFRVLLDYFWNFLYLRYLHAILFFFLVRKWEIGIAHISLTLGPSHQLSLLYVLFYQYFILFFLFRYFNLNLANIIWNI